METNEKHTLKSINWGVVSTTIYRGVLIERLIGGYKVFDKVVATPEEVDRIIDDSKKLFPDYGIYFDHDFDVINERRKKIAESKRLEIESLKAIVNPKK